MSDTASFQPTKQVIRGTTWLMLLSKFVKVNYLAYDNMDIFQIPIEDGIIGKRYLFTKQWDIARNPNCYHEAHFSEARRYRHRMDEMKRLRKSTPKPIHHHSNTHIHSYPNSLPYNNYPNQNTVIVVQQKWDWKFLDVHIY